MNTAATPDAGATRNTHTAAARARARVFIATGADGFIARADGAIDWLERAHAGAPARQRARTSATWPSSTASTRS